MRLVPAVFALAMLAMIAVAAFQGALVESGEDVTIENEEWDPNPGNVTTLDHSNRQDAYYDQNVSVQDNNGDDAQYGEDYIWYQSNGTIKALSGGTLDGTGSANITYGYNRVSDEKFEFVGVVALIPNSVGLLLPAFLIALAVSFLRGG